MKFRIGLIALTLAACTRALPPSPPSPTQVAPRDAAEAVAIVERRDREVETLKALFRLVVRKADGTLETSRGALAVAPPDRLRLQIYSAGLVTAYDYTVNGDRFRTRRPLGGVQQTGRFSEPKSGEDVAAPYDLRPLFLRPAGSGLGRVEETAEIYRVILGPGDERREVAVSKRSGEIVGETLYAGGKPRLRARYRQYRDTGRGWLPYRIDIEYLAEAVTLEIEITSYKRNEPVVPELFEIP